MTCIFPYVDRIFDFILVRENMDQRKPMLLHMLRNDLLNSSFKKYSFSGLKRKGKYHEIRKTKKITNTVIITDTFLAPKKIVYQKLSI